MEVGQMICEGEGVWVWRDGDLYVDLDWPIKTTALHFLGVLKGQELEQINRRGRPTRIIRGPLF